MNIYIYIYSYIASFHKNKLNVDYIQHFVENKVFISVVLFYFVVFISHILGIIANTLFFLKYP